MSRYDTLLFVWLARGERSDRPGQWISVPFVVKVQVPTYKGTSIKHFNIHKSKSQGNTLAVGSFIFILKKHQNN